MRWALRIQHNGPQCQHANRMTNGQQQRQQQKRRLVFVVYNMYMNVVVKTKLFIFVYIYHKSKNRCAVYNNAACVSGGVCMCVQFDEWVSDFMRNFAFHPQAGFVVYFRRVLSKTIHMRFERGIFEKWLYV